MLYKRLEMNEYEEVQFVGVYVLRWKPEWGQPTEMFREAQGDEMLEAARQLPEVKALTSALLSAQTALDHIAPGGCWATGPSTGDPVQDLIVCPGCVALAKIEAVLGAFV